MDTGQGMEMTDLYEKVQVEPGTTIAPLSTGQRFSAVKFRSSSLAAYGTTSSGTTVHSVSTGHLLNSTRSSSNEPDGATHVLRAVRYWPSVCLTFLLALYLPAQPPRPAIRYFSTAHPYQTSCTTRVAISVPHTHTTQRYRSTGHHVPCASGASSLQTCCLGAANALSAPEIAQRMHTQHYLRMSPPKVRLQIAARPGRPGFPAPCTRSQDSQQTWGRHALRQHPASHSGGAGRHLGKLKQKAGRCANTVSPAWAVSFPFQTGINAWTTAKITSLAIAA
eukprot:2845329-Rhodomonas_salina.1